MMILLHQNFLISPNKTFEKANDQIERAQKF